jgi:PAS domain S-box-containing protein
MPLGPASAPAGVVVTFSDITAYRHAQEVLRGSEEKYRGLVEQLPLILLQADRNLRLVYANPALRAVTGYDLQEVAEPAAWEALLHPDDLPRLRALAANALAGVPGRAEFRYRARDGTERAAFVLSHPRRMGQETIGTTSLIVDMTRERRLERELQRAQRLELVGRLASGIAHDFNNLLSVVLSLSELARAGLPPEHPAYQDLLRISQAGEQAARLAGQLLTFGKNRRAVTRPVDVTAVVRHTLGLLHGTLPGGIVVEAHLGDVALLIRGDETELQQVLMNLCLNARDAMPHGGLLGVRCAAEDGPDGQRWLRLSVRDTGVGMPRQVLERIFDPFFSTKERGTGLGLAVVRQIVEAGGGRVEAESEPGRGSAFHVWLPLADDNPPANGREAAAQQNAPA